MMNNRTELATVAPDEWGMIQQQADALVKSGFLPRAIDSWQKAAAIILLGRELGVPPWAALNGINVIQGKPTVSPQLMLGMINAKGQLEDMTIDDTGAACTVTMKRRGRSAHSYTFSVADAKAMGLDGKDNWKKQPAIMRQWRAVAGCARVVFPDVIQGLYTWEEMGADVATDSDGNMVITSIVEPTTGEIIKPAQQSSDIPPAGTPQPPTVPNGAASPASTAPTGSAKDASTDDELPPDTYRIQQVKVVPQGKNSHMYLMGTDSGENIAVFGGDPFRNLGLDPETWKAAQGKWFQLTPMLVVEATLVNDKWTVKHMELAK